MRASPAVSPDTGVIPSHRQFAGEGPSGPPSIASSFPSFKPNNATRTSSCLSQPRAPSPPTTPSTTSALRRTSIPSQGGTDRKRLAIVETDGPEPSIQDRLEKSSERVHRPSDSGGSPPHNLPSRLEAQLGGLALVAPPDASAQSGLALAPPRTAPVPEPQPSIAVSHPLTSNHARSTSDAFGAFPKSIGHVPRKSSREVAIVGTTSFPGSASVLQLSSSTPPATDSLRPPLFQILQSRSPSPGLSELSDSGCSTYRGRQRKDALAPGVSHAREVAEFSTPVRTPNIGGSKHISNRVPGPPVVTNAFPQSPSSSSAFSGPHSSEQDFMFPRTNLSSPLTSPTTMTSPVTISSPYLHYQPGLHATAGPLPPPPQAVFSIDPKATPPPRPPRHSPLRRKGDLEAMKQMLQLPSHVTAALSTQYSSPSAEMESVSTSPQRATATVPSTDSPPSSHESTGSDPPKPHHVREGAFPPSRPCTLDSKASTPTHDGIATSLPRLNSMDDLVASIGLAIDDMGIMSSCDVPPPTVVEPPRGHEGRNGGKGLEIRRADNLPPGLSRSLSSERLRIDPLPSPPRPDENPAQSWVDSDKAFAPEETVPPVPAKNDLPYLDTKLLKNALNIKRFSSLPRTPSLVSFNRPSLGSKCSSGTPSPSVAYSASQAKLPMRKTRSTRPPAMYFADVTLKRTALERSLGYAQKINELYNCDCGLGDWIAETKYRALHPHSVAKRSNVNSSNGPRAPSISSPSFVPRHVSQSSTDSGVTFPRRADAYSATDLAPRAAGDGSPPDAPPPLPYPALAAAPRHGPSRASTMIASSSSSSGRSAASPSSIARSPGSFFVSLGRKASIKKKPSTPPSPPKTLSKSPPRNVNERPSPRPVNLQPVAPSVPGGPRAPPNRMQRSQTIVITSQNSVNGPGPQRSSTMARRPSLFDSRGSVQQANNSISGADFNRQVDKLAALLPKADKNVLAIYLRRTGQDILAIGQYLEDEKNGTLRYE